MFIYTAVRKAYSIQLSLFLQHYHRSLFCSACFQLRSTTTGKLLLIRHPRRVGLSGRVYHRHLLTMTHLIVQGVRTLRQWSRLPKDGTIWHSYCHVLDLSLRTNYQANTPTIFRHIAPRWGRSATKQRQGQTNGVGCRSTEAFSH